MLNKYQKYGMESETAAVKYLKKKGYKIIERNFKTKYGEIDIIAKDGETIVFIEVKARKNQNFGSPKESITYTKIKKISKSALFYLKSSKQMNKKARFDVAIIKSFDDSQKPDIELIKNAFPTAY
jgi:putative endonuclease